MSEFIEGTDGIYKIKHRSKIYQYKINSDGRLNSAFKLHIITDTIENDADRKKVAAAIQKMNLNVLEF